MSVSMLREGSEVSGKFIYRDVGMLFSLSISTIMLSYYSIMSNTGVLLLQSVIISMICFLAFSYLYTLSIGKQDIILLRIAFGIYIVDCLLITINDNDIMVVLSSAIGFMGLILSFMKNDATSKKYKGRQKKRRSDKEHDMKRDEIDRELDDPWKEEPHVIYDNFELEKFNI